MTVMTLLAVTTITNGTHAEVKVALTWPNGDTQRETLQHDWAADMWDWRHGHAPTSLTRRLRELGIERLHGVRIGYASPANTGTSSNELGRIMVYEIEYEE